MRVLGIIPARYASTRLEGKPLADIAGKPMIRHVYERAMLALNDVIVATDDERIFQVVKNFGGHVVMTSPAHNTGTNRCLEAYRLYSEESGKNFDVIINIQGDEPLLEPALLNQLSKAFLDPETEMATLAARVTHAQELEEGSAVFLVLDKDRNALYFSRFPIPYVRGKEKSGWPDLHPFLKHIGMYAYTPKALEQFAEMPLGELEKAESLEQLRWLQGGRKIKVVITEHAGISVDTPGDLERVKSIFAAEKKNL